MRKSTFRLLAVFSFGCAVFLVGGGVILLGGVSSSPKSTRVQADFNALGSALRAYVINTGEPPATHQGLRALVTMPTTAPVPKRWSQIMKKKPLDPWMMEYQYLRLPAAPGSYRYELRSAGPDGVFGNADDFAEVFGR